MWKNKAPEWLLHLILAAAILIPRLAGLGSFSTLDEPYWLSMGANFYYALGQREFENTIYEYQPAVTTMEIVTAAMLLYFPEYRGMGQGYLEFEKGALDPFLLEHGKSPLTLLHLARALQSIFVTLLFLLLYFLLKKILPHGAAFFAVLFASFEPFFLGQSRLLNHEGMLALFVLISALALYVHLRLGGKPAFLILSGAAAGLAQLTKSSALAMLLPIGLLLLWNAVPFSFGSLWKQTKIFALWLAILVLTYFALFPGMWVAPSKTLYVIYGNAASYSLQGARLYVTEELQPAQFGLANALVEFQFFLRLLLFRATPLTWAGVLLAGFAALRRADISFRAVMSTLLASAAAFVLLFSLAQGRNSAHYILTSYLALSLLAGLGWVFLFDSLRQTSRVVLLVLVFAAQAVGALAMYPYYYAYSNPLLRAAGWYADFPQMAYGEGLELAAQYLAELPDAEESTALAYYARGCFSFFYPGETTRFKPYYAEPGHESELQDALQSADYLVVYDAVQGKLGKYDSLFAALENAAPLRRIALNGYLYVSIYDLNAMPPSVKDALSK